MSEENAGWVVPLDRRGDRDDRDEDARVAPAFGRWLSIINGGDDTHRGSE